MDPTYSSALTIASSSSSYTFFKNPNPELRYKHKQQLLFSRPNNMKSKYRFRRLCILSPKAAARSIGTRSSGSNAYRQSQSIPATAPLNKIAEFVFPAGAFLAITFVLWKVVEKVLVPQKQKGRVTSSSGENFGGLKWSFGAGTNLASSGFNFKIERESRQKLNDFAKELRSFQSVDMSGRNFGDEGLFFLAESLGYNQSAEEVDFSGNGITTAGLKAFDGILQTNTVLKTLNLSGNAIGDEGAKEIHLHGNGIGNEGARALMSGLSAHKGRITLLDIGNNEIGSKGAFHVAEYIKKSKHLLWLNLYMNDIGDEGAQRIADALKENRSISTIDLGGNNIHASGASEIARVLKDNSVITTLELGYNPIGPEGAKALCEVIKFHGKLETLKLGWCQLGPKGAEYIADAIKYNTTISTLDLRANGLMDDGAVCLAQSLKIVNEALTSVDLGFNEIRDKGAFALAQALKANEDITLTSLNLASNFLTKYGQVALTDARDHVYEMTEKEINIFF